MVAGVKTTLQWLLPSTAYHHRHVIVGRSLCITCSILPILILPIVSIISARLVTWLRVAGVATSSPRLRFPPMRAAEQTCWHYFFAVICTGSSKMVDGHVHVFLLFGTFCLFIFKIILQISLKQIACNFTCMDAFWWTTCEAGRCIGWWSLLQMTTTLHSEAV